MFAAAPSLELSFPLDNYAYLHAQVNARVKSQVKLLSINYRARCILLLLSAWTHCGLV